MEMCYDGALAMPSNYVVMDEEEMTYTQGGWCIENKWWGYNIYLTHKERKLVSDGQLVIGVAAGLTSCGIGAAILTVVGGLISNHDDGHGVRIRMTGLKRNAVMTGVYALTKKQEKNKASKNAILF